jgi:hypothetical protein
MQSSSTTLLLGGATVAAACLLVNPVSPPQLITTQGGLGVRALQRFSTITKLPRNIRNSPKGGFEPRMSRYEAAQIVGVRYAKIPGTGS